jgi:hypothetical protein
MADWIINFGYSLAACVVLFLPGLALLAWLPGASLSRRAFRRDPLSTLADAAALSIALSALAGLWLFIARIQLSAAFVAAIYALCFFMLISAVVWRGVRLPAWSRLLGQLVYGASAAAFIAALAAWRLYQARGIPLPPWVDPVHHTLIVRIIYESGGITPDFSSYIEAPFYYHFGFHLITALFAFWTRLPAHEAVLWFGQVVNAAVALSVYRAAYSFASALPGQDGNGAVYRQAAAVGLTAAVLVGFVFQMPAYYFTWGRYTLLAGLILLGPALAAVREAWSEPERTDAWLRLALLLAAMSLTHYFAVILTGLFILLLFAWGIIQAVRQPERRLVLVRLVIWCVLGFLVVSPWLWHVIQPHMQSVAIRIVSPFEQGEAGANSGMSYLRYIFFLIGPRHNHILMLMAGAGLMFALLRSHLRLFAVWSLLLVFLSLPWGIRFELFRPDYFAIVLFFPAAVVLADLLVSASVSVGSLIRAQAPWPDRVSYTILVFVIALFAVWGLRETRNIVNPVTVLATHADVAALEWVEENTPSSARFFINSTPWMGGHSRGVDGGYWLVPYTGRSSLLPPVWFVWGETEYVQKTFDWVARSTKIQGCNPDFWNLVRDASLTHIYLRQGSGNLQPEMLKDCPRLDLRYQQDGVFIYEINRPQ